MPAPAWLPDEFLISGDWDQDLADLREIFEADFKRPCCFFKGKRVVFDNRIIDGDYEEGFWHLITKDEQSTKERLFDPRRAERLPWCSPVLQNCDDGAVKVWSRREGSGKIRTYVWLEDFDYVIILDEKNRVYFLVTAHHIDGDRRRNQLKTKYETRET